MKLPRRTFLKRSAGGAVMLAAVGCEAWPGTWRDWLGLESADKSPFQPPSAVTLDPVVHALNRLTFGPRPGDYLAVRRLATTPEASALAFVEQQLDPEKIPDDAGERAARRFETLQLPRGELFEYQQDLLHEELMRATLARAVYSERQLFEIMVQFWSDHFNIDPSKGDCKWLKVADDREVIRPHALGRFSELLRASALSPAMLWYLDGRVNRRQTAADRPNENYARELLELHTLGVHGGYSQADVMEVARCLTGWTVRAKGQPPYLKIGQVDFDPDLHDPGAKKVLGELIPAMPAGVDHAERERRGRQELDRVLEIVCRHPATAQHLSEKLCRRFIAEEPPPLAVRQVAEAFRRSEGDIPTTLRAVFAAPAFWDNRGNKVKRPFNYVASALRAAGAQTDAGLPLIDYLRRMGHAPFSYPTPDGYPEKAAPWMGTLLWRWNFAVALSLNQMPGTHISIQTLRERAGGDPGLMAHLLGRMPTPAEAAAYNESGAGLALLLASPAFQRC